MLGRASLPLLRPRILPVAGRIRVPQNQLRFYAKSFDSRLGRKGEYKVPDTAKPHSWQQSTSLASDAQSKTPKEPIRPVPQSENESINPQNLNPEIPSNEDKPEFVDAYQRQPKPSDRRLDTAPKSRESASEEPVDEVDAAPTGPLPDLTKGIPSTLDAELSQARAKRGHASASLNITEDPSEPLPEDEDAGGRPRTPRSEYVSSGDQRKNTAVKYTYLILALGITGYSAYLGRNWESEEEEKKHADAPSGWGFGLFYNRIKARLGSTMSYYNDPVTTKLLPDEETDPAYRMPFTLVISLDDMLVHQEWTRATGWRIAKRPGLDYFLRYLSQYYELVLFTSQPSAMADQVLRKLDPYSTIRWPLYREATLYKDGGYIKDLSYLNRDLSKVIIMDTDAHHVKHQPENAILLPKWKGDPKDQTLVQFIPFLEYLANMGFDDARTVLKSFDGKYIPAEFARREKLLREKFEAQESEKRQKKPKKSFGVGSIFGSWQRSPDGIPTADEAAAEGKMLWDLIRERGQKNYMEFEKKIREEGEKWLAEREAEEKRLQEEAMKSMTSGFLGGWFGGSKGEEKK